MRRCPVCPIRPLSPEHAGLSGVSAVVTTEGGLEEVVVCFSVEFRQSARARGRGLHMSTKRSKRRESMGETHQVRSRTLPHIFIADSINNRLSRGLLLLISLVMIIISLKSTCSVFTLVCASVGSLFFYWVPAWLPSKLNTRNQAAVQLGKHPVAWALWQGMYTLIISVYLQFIISCSELANNEAEILIPVAIGAGWLTSYGERNVIKFRFQSYNDKKKYEYVYIIITSLFGVSSSLFGIIEGWVPGPLLWLGGGFNYASLGDAFGLILYVCNKKRD